MSNQNIHEKVPVGSVLNVRATGSLQDEVEKELEMPTPPKEVVKAQISEDSNEDTEEHD